MRDNGASRSYVVKHLYHLGFVAGMCDYLGLVDLIDEKLGKSVHQKLSYGQIIKEMIINGLGYTSQPIYLVADFFQDKAIDRLISEDAQAEYFNESVIGRAMDKCFDYGVSSLYSEFAEAAINKFGIIVKALNIDTTSFHVDGDYDVNMDAKVIKLVKGYSRDHRPDLNQAILQLIVENQAGIPVHMQALSGNINDKKSFANTIKEHISSLSKAFKNKYIVGDSALYNPETIEEIDKSGNYFVTRVPSNLNLAKELINENVNTWAELKDDYYAYEKTVEYAGVTQRYILVMSTSAKSREIKTTIKNIKANTDKEYKAFAKLCKKEFACKADAETALREFQTDCSLVEIAESLIIESPCFNAKGKPKKDQIPDYYKYTISGNTFTSLEKANTLKEDTGKFIIATNDLDSNFDLQAILDTYNRHSPPFLIDLLHNLFFFKSQAQNYRFPQEG